MWYGAGILLIILLLRNLIEKKIYAVGINITPLISKLLFFKNLAFMLVSA